MMEFTEEWCKKQGWSSKMESTQMELLGWRYWVMEFWSEKKNEQRGEGKKWGVRPATKEVDMPSMFIRGQKHVRGCGLDVSPIRERGGGLDTRTVVHPTPILERGGGLDVHPTPTTRVRGGRLDTRTVVLLLSALLLAASLPQGNSH